MDNNMDNKDKCLNCKHCVQDPCGGGALVCDALAPVIYALLSGPEERAYMAKGCEDFEKKEEGVQNEVVARHA